MSDPGVLVARLDNCGDVLLAGPAIRAAGASGRPVHLLCGPRGRQAAEILPGVASVVECRVPWIDPDPVRLRRVDADRLVRQVRRLDVSDALVLGSSHQSPLPLALLLRWAGVERIAAVSHDYAGSLLDVRIPGDPDLHEVERNLLVAESLGFPRPADDRLQVVLDGDEALDQQLEAWRPYVVVHPGASVPARTLDFDRWVALITELAGAGWQVVVTGSEEESRLRSAALGQTATVLDLAGRTATFRALGRVVAGADAFVGGNTGPLHMAAAVGTPAVAVFPPTVPLERWRPWRVDHVVLGDQDVPCAGCRSRVCPLPRQVCLDPVSPADVVAAIDRLGARRAPVSGIQI